MIFPGADGNQRVEAGLDQAAGVGRGSALHLLRPFALGDIAGGGEHALHVSGGILMDRRIVKHVHHVTGLVPDRKRVIGHRALGKHLLIARAGFLRFRKVAGELRADQFRTRNAGGEFRGRVHVGDLALGTDCHQGILTGLNETAHIRCRAGQAFLGPLPLAQVVNGDIGRRPQQRQHQRVQHHRDEDRVAGAGPGRRVALLQQLALLGLHPRDHRLNLIHHPPALAAGHQPRRDLKALRPARLHTLAPQRNLSINRIPQLVEPPLSGRVVTTQMSRRFEMFVNCHDRGVELLQKRPSPVMT